MQPILESLRKGELSFQGEFVLGTNRTFLVDVGSGNGSIFAVYKPIDGEQPLWDFPANTLALREVAAYLTSEALGWDLVPPTVLRRDGPGGGGSLQFYLDGDRNRHYFSMSDEEKLMLRPAAVFDVLVNNADRKGGHVLITPNSRIRLIDHGICFHENYKLRTVIWDFAGEPVPSHLLSDVKERLIEDFGSLSSKLSELLTPQEIDAFRSRAQHLLLAGSFPEPGPERNYPWPLV